MEKEMAAHSSVLAWRIPGTEEPGGLPSMGSHRVGHDWSNLAVAAGFGTQGGVWMTGEVDQKAKVSNCLVEVELLGSPCGQVIYLPMPLTPHI